MPEELGEVFVDIAQKSTDREGAVLFLSPKLIKETGVGSKTQELIGWLSEKSGAFWSKLEDFSFDWLDAMGWEEIKQPFIELSKKPVANFTRDELENGSFTEAYKSGKLRFTGYGLCGYTTLVIGEAIKRKFPDTEVSWLKIDCDVAEAETLEDIIEDEHHLLSVSFPGEKAVTVDFSYGQIRHDRLMLIIPVDELATYYKGEGKIEERLETHNFEAGKEKYEARLKLPLEEKASQEETNQAIETLIDIYTK